MWSWYSYENTFIISASIFLFTMIHTKWFEIILLLCILHRSYSDYIEDLKAYLDILTTQACLQNLMTTDSVLNQPQYFDLQQNPTTVIFKIISNHRIIVTSSNYFFVIRNQIHFQNANKTHFHRELSMEKKSSLYLQFIC